MWHTPQPGLKSRASCASLGPHAHRRLDAPLRLPFLAPAATVALALHRTTRGSGSTNKTEHTIKRLSAHRTLFAGYAARWSAQSFFARVMAAATMPTLNGTLAPPLPSSPTSTAKRKRRESEEQQNILSIVNAQSPSTTPDGISSSTDSGAQIREILNNIYQVLEK